MRKYNLTIDITNSLTHTENALRRFLFDLKCDVKTVESTVNNLSKTFLEIISTKDEVFNITEYLYKENWSFTSDFYIILSSYGEFILNSHGEIQDVIDGDFEGFCEENKAVKAYDVQEAVAYYKGGCTFDVTLINSWVDDKYETSYGNRLDCYLYGGLKKDDYYQKLIRIV
jgi:hypothetical protein